MNFGFIEFNLVTNRSEKHLKSINGFEEYCPQKKTQTRAKTKPS